MDTINSNSELHMTRFRALRLGTVLLILACTVGCDQAAKHFARIELGQSGSQSLPGGFVEFTLAENPGAFLSLGAALPAVLRDAFFTVAVGLGLAGLLVFVLCCQGIPRLSLLGLTLILAGGMSNLVDRLARHGLVTDFLVVRAGPLQTGVFNLADLAIVVGGLTLALSLQVARGKHGARSDGESKVD